MTPRSSVSGGVRVLHKTIDVLDSLRQQPDGASLATVAADVGMPKPTVYRILATLESRGYLERGAGGSYRVSRKMFEPPRETSAERLLRVARPIMERLVDVCKETVNLGVLDAGEVLVIETVESPLAVRMTSKIGNRRYPHSTALGKVLLADLDARDMRRMVQAKGMPRFTPATIVTIDALVVELERIRVQGFALDNLENELDGRCVGAPVLDPNRKVVAALSISGPLPRMTLARTRTFLKPLSEACRTISAAAN